MTSVPAHMSMSRRELGVWAVVIIGTAAWSVWPVRSGGGWGGGGGGIATAHAAKAETAAPAIAPTDAVPPPLDLAAFRAPLWVVPPPLPAPAAPPPPPPPLNLQLLAITIDKGVHQALVYDPAQDKVVTLKTGDTILGRRVESIDDKSVKFRLKDQLQSLGLDQPAGPATKTPGAPKP